VAIDAVVLSTQHDPEVKQKDLIEAVRELILKHVLPKWLHKRHPIPHQSDRQVRDRRAGGRLRPDRPQDHRRQLRRHGPPRRRRVLRQGSRPRSTARRPTPARYVAKNIVAAGLADRCEMQVSYAIGVAEPTSISVTTFGTGKVRRQVIEKLIRKHFDLRPYGIIGRCSTWCTRCTSAPPLRPLRPQAGRVDPGPRGRRHRRQRRAGLCLEGRDRRGVLVVHRADSACRWQAVEPQHDSG
jgi:hypothetical protein